MADTKRAILQRMIEGIIYDLMMKTHVDNVVYSVNGNNEVLLSTFLAEILMKTDALGTLANKSEISYSDFAASLKLLIDGMAAKGSTLSAYGITDAYTKAQIDGMIADMFTFKGVKDYQNQLPTTGNKVGDVWHVRYSGASGTTAWGMEFVWDGAKWEPLGTAETVDLSGYVKTSLTVNNKPLTGNISLNAADTGAVPATRKVNGKELSTDISLNAADVGAVPTGRTVNGKSLATDISLNASDVNAVPPTRTINGKALSADISLSAGDVGAATAAQGALATNAVPNTRKVNNKQLNADITLNAADVGAARVLHGTTTPVDFGAGDLFLQILS